MECIDCGLEFENAGKRKKPYCYECAFKRAREVSEQLAAREGPYYEKWLLSRDKAVANYRAKMEKAVKRYEESFDILTHLATPVGQAEMLLRIAKLNQELL